jgi:hypothetical protein
MSTFSIGIIIFVGVIIFLILTIRVDFSLGSEPIQITIIMTAAVMVDLMEAISVVALEMEEVVTVVVANNSIVK